MQEFDNWLRKEKLLSLIKLLNVQLYLPKSEFDINDNKINWRMDRFSQRNCILENKHQEILRKNWSQGCCAQTALNTSFALFVLWPQLCSCLDHKISCKIWQTNPDVYSLLWQIPWVETHLVFVWCVSCVLVICHQSSEQTSRWRPGDAKPCRRCDTVKHRMRVSMLGMEWDRL